MVVGVLAHGRYVPDRKVLNSEFIGREFNIYVGEGEEGEPEFAEEKIVLDEAKILRSTGGIMERRRAAEGETTVDFVEKAFASTGFDAKDLDGIVVGTISSERLFPSTACGVQERIGAENAVYAIDVRAACSGFLHALDLTWGRARRDGRNYLVAGVEILTRIVDYGEINADLFGDGCGAMVVGPIKDSSKGIIATHFQSDVSGIDSVFSDKGGVLRMPSGKYGEGGQDVMRKASEGMIDIAHKLLAKTGYDKKDVDLYIPHQANGRIVERIRRKMSPNEGGKVYQNIEKYGNMSAGTVPFAFSEAMDSGRIKEGDLVMLLAAGAGLALGGALIRV